MHVRPFLRSAVVGGICGVVAISAAWAGIGLTPAGETTPSTAARPDSDPPPPPTALVGAAKVRIDPAPDAAAGERWERDRATCATLSPDGVEGTATHVADFRVRWAENPDCLYMGGYGLGPMNPITAVDPSGLWVRAVAFSDGSDTLVLALVDATSYMGAYSRLCGKRGEAGLPTSTAGGSCGALALGETLAKDLGLPRERFGLMLASTHSHTAPDLIGGWGGVPDWYMAQVTRAIRTAVTTAVEQAEPAVVETGEVFARARNSERRDFYRSAEDNAMSWLRAYVPGSKKQPERTIATVGAFAAHPVTVDAGSGVAHADFPVVFADAVEGRFGGGVGMLVQTGLGNLSPRGSTVEMGTGLAALVPDRGTPVPPGDVRTLQAVWNHPVTNAGLTALGLPGFFDRPFSPVPGAVRTGKSAVKPCTSASPVSVATTVTVGRVGNLTFTGAPGETFANLTSTIEEKAPGVAFPLAQVNDGLGYLMQSFETDHAGRQAVGFVGQVAEYEDAYSIDHCFGDKVLEETLRLMGEVHKS
jgi:hypothetical protein